MKVFQHKFVEHLIYVLNYSVQSGYVKKLCELSELLDIMFLKIPVSIYIEISKWFPSDYSTWHTISTY